MSNIYNNSKDKCHKYNENQNKILWQCRRGMLELDEILIKFFHRHYENLTKEMQNNFVELLQENDANLFSYFFSNKLPDSNQLQELILIINSKFRNLY
jgi:antitoxin CptB